MNMIHENKNIPKDSRKTQTIQSDKTMDEVVSKFEEMQAEGKLKIKRSCSYEELKALPPEQLSATERAMIMYRENIEND